MAAEDATAVTEALEQRPMMLQATILPPPQGVPAVGGFYAWWITRGVLADLSERPHSTDESLLLLYVGISPARASSHQTLRSRLIGNHINGNIGSSTFRFSLAAVLREDLALLPRRTPTKITLVEADDACLRRWQFANLRLTWCERERPWEIEHSVIHIMKPPLNLAGNRGHPFYSTLKASRAALRTAARLDP